MYHLIPIHSSSDFDRLVDLLPEHYDPRAVADALKKRVSPLCRTVLVENPYIDKDYRSTYYNFYAKKGYRYESACARLHFFGESVELAAGLKLGSRGRAKLEEVYFGYMVLRPTRKATIGRTVVTPALMDGFHGSVIECDHVVHLLGQRFTVTGFPYMEQHLDISVCAHAACWAILRHYSERYPQYAERLTYDITRMAHEFDPGGLLPSKGLSVQSAERIFAAAGTYPMIVARDEPEPNRGLFHRQLVAYVESGFPLFASIETKVHAVAIVGHGNVLPVPQTHPAAHFAADLIDGLIAVDDNFLPYVAIPNGHASPYGIEQIDSFIVPLPEKVYYSAEAVDELSAVIASDNYLGFDHSSLGPPVIRYFLTSASKLRARIHELRSQFDPDLVQLVMQLALPQFVWVVEVASADQWNNGRVATRAIIDATASPQEEDPVFLVHDLERAHVFNRGGDYAQQILMLNSPAGAELSRMKGNVTSH